MWRKGASTIDEDERKEIYAQILQIMMDEMPGFLIAHRVDLFAAKNTVQGFNPPLSAISRNRIHGPLVIRHHGTRGDVDLPRHGDEQSWRHHAAVLRASRGGGGECTWAAYLIRRLLGLIPVLFVISVVTFLTTALVRGDAASVLLGPTATPERSG